MEKLNLQDFEFIDIESVEQIETQDSYVYDIEVDKNHNLFANDILVSNSIYIEFGGLLNQLQIPENEQTKFVVDLWYKGCGPYIKQKFEEYAKRWNCNKNLQDLELEKVSSTAILLAKKHYALNVSWTEPGIFLDSLEHVTYKGLEHIQGSTPKYAKECMNDLYMYILDWYETHTTPPSYESIVKKFETYKKNFVLQDPEDICKGSTIGDYEKFILSDKRSVEVGKHCPIHVKGAAAYNNKLYNGDKKYLAKYEFIKTGNKVKFYPTTHACEVFAFSPNKFPYEFAPPIDYEDLFDKTILTPLNRLLTIVGLREVNLNLLYSSALW